MIIYIIINLINYKIYIGQDKNNNPKYYGSGKLIKKEIKLCGKKNFKKGILYYCNSKEQMNEKEEYYIKLYNSTDRNIGYNIRARGNNGHTPEIIEIIRKANIGNQNAKGHIKTEEGRKRISETHKGKKQSPEHAKKSALARTGLKMSDKNKQMLIKINTGRIVSLETRQKLSVALRGKPAPNKGKPHYGFRKIFSIADKYLIYIMFNDGCSLKDIYNYFNVSHTPIYTVLKELGLYEIKSSRTNN